MSHVFKGWDEPGSDWYSEPCLNAVASAYWNLSNELGHQPTEGDVARRLRGQWSADGVDWALQHLRLGKWAKKPMKRDKQSQ